MQEQSGTKALVNIKNEDEKNEDEFFLDRSEEKRTWSYYNF
jgi:hypothetical protein